MTDRIRERADKSAQRYFMEMAFNPEPPPNPRERLTGIIESAINAEVEPLRTVAEKLRNELNCIQSAYLNAEPGTYGRMINADASDFNRVEKLLLETAEILYGDTIRSEPTE